MNPERAYTQRKRGAGRRTLRLHGTTTGDQLALKILQANFTAPEPQYEVQSKLDGAWGTTDVGSLEHCSALKARRERLIAKGALQCSGVRIMERTVQFGGKGDC